MSELRTWHNDPAIKAKYDGRMADHIAADELVRGVSWEPDGKPRGCAVGCLLHKYDHRLAENEIGFPVWAVRLLDTLHENVSVDYQYKGLKLARAFTALTPVGKDLTRAQHKTHIFIQARNLKRVQGLDIEPDLKKQVTTAVEKVIALHQNALDTGKGGESVARSAKSAAGSAWSAGSTARSADSAAESAWSATKSEEHDAIADEFMKLLEADDG